MPSALDSFRLDGRLALVTGASRGIGQAIATALAEAGAELVLTSRKVEAAQAVASALEQAGHRATAIACHNGRESDIDALFGRIRSEWGRLDVLVNNAATNPLFGPMSMADQGAITKTFEVNVNGMLFCTQRAAAIMADQAERPGGRGSIVNIASVAGLEPMPGIGVYSATKAAVINLTRGFANELAAAGIRVNAIAPGLVETKFAAALIETPEIAEQALRRIPLGRFGQPHAIGGAALFLASAASSYVTGSVLVVSGGYL
ncbi:MAG: glucose 1-dehydrogenase [Deltaproteobacteria bacterium]|nr:glucose 1-dehydrogenase [Deltaproteobacteria bacterium]